MTGARRLARHPIRRPDRGSALVLGWLLFRLVQYPPFVEFLIATEAEMNKVSWTSRDDLYRATTVVLLTVTLMSLYLFGVDWDLVVPVPVPRRVEVRRLRLDSPAERPGWIFDSPFESDGNEASASA